ncbi:hypothetical protein [Streptomyces sp. KAU_LT]|uniref:hypothetical protein n=1 Tax=Streptomyces sp. KAU_LT TaxID=3046669 RepID=UPI0024B78793|nr:hypothetical protein [Streptomyces sp. KAU_LT]MDI9836260.1 hypothetical protein [Streptomyces sp. KAU_LT]
MAAPALYGVTARRTADGQLLACESTSDPKDFPELLQRFTARYADRPDVLLDLDTTPVDMPVL